MNTRIQFIVVFFAGSLLETSAAADTDDFSEWLVRGDSTVVAESSTLARLTGRLPATAGNQDEKLSVVWPEARLETSGRAPLNVRMEVELTTGHTMAVGEDTPYPGLITKLSDARGQIIDFETGRISYLRLSERGDWIGKFIHSYSAGSDHLAVEIPFSLYDKATDALTAQSNLLAGFDLTSRPDAFVYVTRISPTSFSDLRLQTTDIGRALQGQTILGNQSKSIPLEIYYAEATVTKSRAIVDRNQVEDLFNKNSFALYGCNTGEFLELELQSSGFAQSGLMKTPQFTLRLRYAPAMTADGKITYLESVAGELAFHYKDTIRLVEFGPGNHGHVASVASLSGNDVTFRLGIALREGSATPVVARLDVACTTDVITELRCDSLKIATATDPEGRTTSPATLSTVLEKPFSFADFSVPIDASEPQIMGASPGCKFLCPSCLTEGCDTGSGLCAIAAAPVGCSTGCPHYNNEVQCCRSGSSKVCCVPKCGDPN